GSNIGAFLTPVGALAGIMWTSLLKKHDIKYTFADFIRYGIVISVPTIFASLFVLDIVLK
ncbi:MAG: ArsB/NhaD family transporter, partial [Clostridia bacterium]|nr:ArsB/NhaD family transporter [Clostridia bacterium]